VPLDCTPHHFKSTLPHPQLVHSIQKQGPHYAFTETEPWRLSFFLFVFVFLVPWRNFLLFCFIYIYHLLYVALVEQYYGYLFYDFILIIIFFFDLRSLSASNVSCDLSSTCLEVVHLFETPKCAATLFPPCFLSTYELLPLGGVGHCFAWHV
jgi:hypothetical protein